MDHAVVHHKMVTRGRCKQLLNLQSEVLVFNIIIIIIIIFLAHNLVAQQVFAVCHSAILNLLSRGGGDSFGLLATKKREPPLHKCKDPSLTLYKSRYICLWGLINKRTTLILPHCLPSIRSIQSHHQDLVWKKKKGITKFPHLLSLDPMQQTITRFLAQNWASFEPNALK